VTFKWTRSIAHQPLTALEQWKASRHWSLWVAVGICTVSKWTAPREIDYSDWLLLPYPKSLPRHSPSVPRKNMDQKPRAR